MSIIKAEQVVAFFADESARVSDEVARIAAILTERAPGSNRPKHIEYGRFLLRVEDADVDFMTKVAAAFESLGEGWSAKVLGAHDITGHHQNFVLSHESFKTLPGQGGDGLGRFGRISRD